MSSEAKSISFNYSKWSLMRGTFDLAFKFQPTIINIINVHSSDKYVRDDFKTYLSELIAGLTSILSNIFNCDGFSIELFDGDHIRVSLEVVKILLQKSMTHNEWYLNHEQIQKNILHHLLFVAIPNGLFLHWIHLKKNFWRIFPKFSIISSIETTRLCASKKLYSDSRNRCAALLLSTTVNKPAFAFLEQILVEATFTDNPYLIPVLLDIWSIFLR